VVKIEIEWNIAHGGDHHANHYRPNGALVASIRRPETVRSASRNGALHARRNGAPVALEGTHKGTQEDAAPSAPASSLRTPPDAGAVTTNLQVGGQALATSSAAASRSIVAEIHGEEEVDPRKALLLAILRADDPGLKARYIATYRKQYRQGVAA
jgi:hypothetical protein